MYKANKAAGMHFFDDETMDFFNSKVETDANRHGFFITSEKNPWGNHPRMYTVRRFDPSTGGIEKASEFEQFSTLLQAKKAMGTYNTMSRKAGGVSDDKQMAEKAEQDC